MDRNRLLVVLIFVSIFGLVSFGAAVYFYQERSVLQQELNALSEGPANPSTETSVQEGPAVVASGDESDTVKALNEYIDKLESENLAFRRQLEQMGGERNRDGRGGPGGWRGGFPNLDELRESNPQEYARIMEARQQMEQRMQEFRDRRDDYFASMNTSKLTPTQRGVLKDYQGLIADFEEGMRNPGSRGDMREMGRQLMEMRGEVQDILIEELGTRFGTDGNAMYEGVQEIMSVMGGGMMMGPPQGGFGGPGGRGGFGGPGGRGGFGGPGRR